MERDRRVCRQTRKHGSLRQTKYPDKRESAASAKIRLNSLLYGCTDAALAGLTAQGICNTHRGVSLKEAEYMLTIQRQRRAERDKQS